MSHPPHTWLRIARMQPLHHGHIDAIQQALETGIERLIIGIGSSNESHTAENPLHLEERMQILQTALEGYGVHKLVEIYPIPDFVDDARWVDHIQTQLPDFDTVISNNPWVLDIFAEQKKHILQPVERIPVRASDIRQAIIDNNIEFLRQYLLPHTLQHLHELDIADRLSKIV